MAPQNSQQTAVTNPAAVPPDPMEDPVKRKQVEAARTVLFHLSKAIKQIGMYRHAEAKFPEFLQKACDALSVYTKEYGTLTLKVEVTNFTLHKVDLFPEDSPIPYKFFKDGIRQLIFRDEFSVEELVSFTLISLTDPDRGADDLNAQLWRAQMPHFEFIMVEGFKMDEFGEEEVQVEVDKVVDYLQRRLRAESDDYLRFARVSEDDLEAQLDGIEQMRGVVVTGITADASLKAKLQKDIFDEENQRLFPKLIAAVFQVVESGVDDPRVLEDMFVQLLDAMLLQEDFATINQVVLKLRAMEQRAGIDSPISMLLHNFLMKMGEEQRLSRIGDVMRTSKPKNGQDVIRYLTGLDSSVVPIILSVLEQVELAENRTLLCDVLVHYSKEVPEPFVNRLKSDRPQTVRDMIYVLDKANHPDKLKYFADTLRSRNLAIRLEVMGIIARGRTGEARKLISSCLEDENVQVRMQAARVLPEFDREKAYTDLLRLVKEPTFAKKEPKERESFYTALGSTGVAGAISYFQGILSAKGGLFNKQKIVEDKLLAVAGMAGACTIATFKFLNEVTADASQPPEVVHAAKMAAMRTKKTLFGDAKEH
jgi:hypothetical protein